jgi:hypothetical protein
MPSLISLLCGVLSPFHLFLWELLDDLHERFAGAAGDFGSCGLVPRSWQSISFGGCEPR